MKAKKALKRLAKIEALISDVTERFSKSSLQIREALQNAKAVFARVKEAVSSQASSGTAKDSKAPSTETPKPARRKLSAAGKKAIQEGVRRRMAQRKEAATNADQSKKKAAPARKKAAAKMVAAKTPPAMTATKNAPIRKAAKKTAPKKTAQAPVKIPATVQTAPAAVRAATKPAAQGSMGK